jgi:hypothetical protein
MTIISETYALEIVRQVDELEAENTRLRAALRRIADHPQGQVFSAGFAPADAHEMQEIAILAVGANGQLAALDKDV